MKRRKFIALLGGMSALLPVAARAQQPAMPVIGLISPTSREMAPRRMSAFRQGLNETGYVEGRYDLMPDLVADLLRRGVTLIATPGTALAAQAAKAATASVPIVFAVGDDPVKLGLVASLARPGGNLTGVNFFNTELAAKQFGLLRELLPRAIRVAVLVNQANATAAPTLGAVEAAARAIGVQVQPITASTTWSSQVLGENVLMPCLSVGMAFSTADVSSWLIWRAVTRFLRHMRTVFFPKSAVS